MGAAYGMIQFIAALVIFAGIVVITEPLWDSVVNLNHGMGGTSSQAVDFYGACRTFSIFLMVIGIALVAILNGMGYNAR